MSILGLQRQVREVGRIRIGAQVAAANGKRRPTKLDTMRFTSRDRTIIETVAQLYGGTVRPWEDQWEVVSETTDLPIMLPPADMALDQHYEAWGKNVTGSSRGGGGFCLHRCDGEWDVVADAACSCDPENRECSIHTRLWVMLPDVPGLGRWRLESQGYYAAVELAGVTELLAGLAGRSVLVPARLRLEQRERRVLAGGKPEVRKYAVPVIDVDASLNTITGGSLGAGVGVSPPPMVHSPAGALSPPVSPSTPAPTPVGWRPVGEQPAIPPAPIAEQAEANTERKPRKPRKNAAEPIKPTGLKPGGGDDDSKLCHLCGTPWGDDPLVRNRDSYGGRFVHRACAEERDGGGGMDTPQDDVAPVRGGPAPAVAHDDPDELITNEQMRKLMATASEAFAKETADMEPAVRNELVRNHVLAMAAKLGQEVESRKDLTKATASAVIDALAQIIDGTAGWNGRAFVDPNSGEVFA